MRSSKLWFLGLLGLLGALWSQPADAACAGGICYVRSGGGNINNTTTTFSVISTSGAACSCAPATSADSIVLDSVSGNLTINANTSIGFLDTTGNGGTNFTGTISQTSTIVLTLGSGIAGVANQFKLNPNMTYTTGASSTTNLLFANTSGTAVLTSAGQTLPTVTMNGLGGTLQLADNLAIGGSIIQNGGFTLTAGAWDCNGKTITANEGAISGTGLRTFTCGSLKLGGNIAAAQNAWNAGTTTNLTLLPNTLNIEIVPPTSQIQGFSFSGGGLQYAGLTVDNNTTSGTTFNILGSNGFASMTIGSGWTVLLPAAGTTTMISGGALAVTGTQTAFTELISPSGGGGTTISSAGSVCTATWAVLASVIGSGACSFTATNTINQGNNTNWTITAPTFGGGSSGSGNHIIGGS